MGHEINTTVCTDAGEYVLVAEVNSEGSCDTNINLYVGRHCKLGHHDLIASDNASCWVVGDADNAARNREQFEIIEGHGLDMDAVRAIDADLADWLEERKEEAVRYERDNIHASDWQFATPPNCNGTGLEVDPLQLGHIRDRLGHAIKYGDLVRVDGKGSRLRVIDCNDYEGTVGLDTDDGIWYVDPSRLEKDVDC